jgi:hypothetical protein
MPRLSKESHVVLRMAFSIAVVAGVVVAAPVRAQTPSTLTGETLTGTTTTAETRGDCRTDDNVSLTYTVSGTATGPYPGTFSETGTLRLLFFGPPEARLGIEPVKGDALDATFEIDSQAGQVTGEKGGIALGRSQFVLCTSTGDLDFPAVFAFQIVPGYIARIETEEGVFVDQGRTHGPWVSSGDQVTITEIFVSDFAVVVASKEQCKLPAFEPFFRNHGRCVQAFK